ncbi:protein kinase C-like 2 isoform X1 [Biomphalaria glabrata]|uniref:Protein kinase C-like 2 isoform X1 n=1 Tax=Biomphalaria glabrata TaxID=6526 RepID=A0A9W3AIR2_BIOGL|nr:protein kinase C-like 2 isoform X1 [Biomphalaria glabrata]
MASSLARFRNTMKPTPEKITCPYYPKPKDTRDEKFPTFTKDLYFSAFPAPIPVRQIDDDKEVDHSQLLKQMANLGSGRFGKTFTVMPKDFTNYACTIVPKQSSKLMVALTRVETSKVDYLDILRATDPFILDAKEPSPFICKILLRFRSLLPYQVEHYVFVSEYWIDALSMCKYLQDLGFMKEGKTRFYLMELADAVMYIHSRGMILRRLSLCSLLIEPSGHLKLTPYSLCEQNLDCGQPCNMLVKICGDQFYASPEVVFGVDVQYAADWWSFGVIAFQLLTGRLPFTGRTLGDLGKAITEENVEFPNTMSGEAVALIKYLLHKDPRRRLGFSHDFTTGSESGSMAIKSHPFFQGIAWLNVRNTLITPPVQPLAMKAENKRINLRKCPANVVTK